MRRVLLIAVVALFAGALAASGLFFMAQETGRGPGKVIIAIQPTQSPAEMLSRASELERFLEEKTGLDVEISVPTTYAAVIEALRFGNAHAALMGSWPAAMAARVAEAEVILAEVRRVSIDGEEVNAPFYYSYWIVRPDSPYTKLSDLRGKTACFPSPLSSSGYLAPVARLVELGLVSREGGPADPREFFGDVRFGGGYGQCWEALRRRQVDVAVIAGDVPSELYNEVLSSSRVIEKQGPLPSHALVVSKSLPSEVRERLREAFLDLGSEQYRDLMRKVVSGLFVRFQETTTDEHLGSLIRFMEITGLTYS